jgi:hypothetical protein
MRGPDDRLWQEPTVHRSAAMRQLSEGNLTLGCRRQYRRASPAMRGVPQAENISPPVTGT